MRWLKWLGSLLYLIGYVGILSFVLLAIAGGVFLFDSSTTLKADRGHAENTCYNVVNALSAYHTEYREYPILDPTIDVTIDSERGLMDILFGSDTQKEPGGRNPRGIAFYTDRAARPMGEGRFRRGVTLEENGDGELWDPWGKHYRVRLDTNGDGKIENPAAPGTHLPESILVWSAGPDGDFATWKDNVKSW